MVRTTQRAGGATGCAVRRRLWLVEVERQPRARSRSSHASSDAAVATTSVRRRRARRLDECRDDADRVGAR